MSVSSLRLPAALLALMTLGACARLTQPDIDVPVNWQASADGAEAAALPDTLWWQRFQSQELSRLIDEALTNNHDLKRAVFRVLQAESSAIVAGSALFPSVSAGLGASRSVRQITGGQTSTSVGYQGTL